MKTAFVDFCIVHNGKKIEDCFDFVVEYMQTGNTERDRATILEVLEKMGDVEINEIRFQRKYSHTVPAYTRRGCPLPCPKFSIGDTIFFLHENKVTSLEVQYIAIGCQNVTYMVQGAQFDSEKCFETKEELIASL